MHWIPYAMVRVAAVFVAGILACLYEPELLSVKWAAILLLTCTLLYYLVRFSLQGSSNLKLTTGTLGLSAILFAGYLNVLLNDESRQPNHLLQSNESATAYQIKLITSTEEKEKSWKRMGKVEAIFTMAGWKAASGKVNLYWPKSELVASLDYGDILIIKGSPREVEPPHNPYEFDLRRFLSFRNIYHQHFVRPGEWTLARKSKDQGILYYAHRARNWSVTAIKKFISSPRERAIVTALVLGVTDGLDNELQNAYAASGAMHILAVSGLHVSIIYGILLLFLRPLGKRSGGPWIIAIVSLVLLWGYAFITGLSPSVLRAVAMFSFVAIAKPLNKNTNIYNTLAASAFFLLLYDPLLIMSVGFQLSYLAVLGIVYLQRPLYNLWEAKSPIMNWVWQISCVSIAAQVATISLGLLYFHQFPVYFLLANLFVIPGSSVVLVGGILLLMLSPFAEVASWLGIALEWFVKILNEGVFLVERMPYSLINNIYVSPFQCFLLFTFILAGLALIQFRKFHFVLLMTFAALLFSISSWQHFSMYVRSSSWSVFRSQGHRVMEWTKDGQSLFIADSSFGMDKTKIGYHVQPNRLMRGVREVHPLSEANQPSYHGLQLYCRDGKSFLTVSSKEFQLPIQLHVDYLIISNNSIKSLRPFAKHVNFDHLIFDSSNSYRYCERLEKEAREMSISSYSVLKQGAYTLNL